MAHLALQTFIDVAKQHPINAVLTVQGKDLFVDKEPKASSGCLQDCFSSCASYFYPPTEQEKELNRKTWEAFEKAVQTAYNPDSRFNHRVAHFCQRYGLDFETFKKEGTTPLTIEHVEKACLGGAKIFKRDLEILCGADAVPQLSYEQLKQRIHELRSPFFIRKPLMGLDKVRPGPETCRELFVYDPFILDRKRMLFDRKARRLYDPGHAQLPDFPFIDRLTKRMLTFGLEKGEIVSAATPDGKRDFYVVYDKIGTGHGLYAVALKPLREGSTLKPLLAFRATQISLVSEDTVETWRNDTQEQIGKLGYEAAKESLKRLFNDREFRPEGTKIRVSGYSLGSTQLSRLVADEDFTPFIEEAIFINGPSLDTKTATDFKNRINALPHTGAVQLKIFIYRNRAQHVDQGDIADYGGEKHIGWGVEHPEFPIFLTEFVRQKSDPRPLLRVHGDLARDPDATELYTAKPYYNQDLQNQLNNSARGPAIAWYEWLRRFWGLQIIYNIVFGIYSFAKCVFDLCGIQFFRSSAPSPEV